LFGVSGARAATGVNWGGGSGGTEAAPLDVYDLSNWSGVSGLSDAYDLTFDAGNIPTVLTNSCADAATTKIANGFKLKYGTWTMLGDYKFSYIDTNNSGTEPKVTTIVKKGDWELTYAAYLGRSGATTILTNVSGKIVQSGSSWFQIGNGNGGIAIVENLSGDWDIKGALELGHGAGSRGELYWRGGKLMQNYTSKPFSLGYGDNTSAVVEKYAGDWTTTDNMIIANGQNSIARFKHDGGKLTVGRNFVVGQGANSEATLNWRGGDLTVGGYFYASQGSNSVATITKDAGDWTITGEVSLGRGSKNVTSTAATTFYHNGGSIVAEGYMDMTWENSCDFHMNGGEVYVANDIRFGQWYLASPEYANVYLNGGVLSAKSFRYHNGNKAVDNIVFDGGTFKAAASGDIATGDSSYATAANLRNRLGFKVGPKGGTIDTAGHDITNVVNFTRTSGSGGMRFVGGGSVVLTGTIGYTGKTFVEVGTKLEVTDASAKDTILNTRGLDIVGYAASGDYTVFTYEGGLDAETDLVNVTCSFAPDSTFEVVGNSIVCHYVKPDVNIWTGSKDNNLSDVANWSDGVVPTGNAFLSLVKPAVLTVGDTFAPATLTIGGGSAVVTIGAGDLQIEGSLTNANRLAIAQGASLTVAGDLVVGDGQGTFLYSNEGTVTVTGNAVCANMTANTTTRQFEVVTENTKPIQATGLLYNLAQSGRIYWRLESGSTGAGAWVVGKDGLKFINPENRYSTRFYAQNSPVTLYSSANWTLANTGKSNTSNGDLEVYDTSSLTIDTTDYDDKTTAHTVTLEGRIKADGNVTIAGCGTVIVDTTANPSGLTDTTVASGKTIAVTDTATLQVNAGKKILGEGTISLSSGTTLAFESTANTFATPDIVPVTLPAEGAATIRIDGERLKSGEDFTVCSLTDLPDGYVLKDHLNITGTALDGRKYEVKTVEVTENETTVTKLVLNIYPAGMMVIIR